MWGTGIRRTCSATTRSRTIRSRPPPICLPRLDGEFQHPPGDAELVRIAPATSYKVKRSTVKGGPYTTIATTNAMTVNYVDDAIPGGQTYYYVVSA